MQFLKETTVSVFFLRTQPYLGSPQPSPAGSLDCIHLVATLFLASTVVALGSS